MKIITTAMFILCAHSVQSQFAPNFTVTDIEGETHTLYDYLDAGKVVVLDFYAVWCGPCQDNAPGVENLWQERGPDGTDEIFILGLEADDSSSDDQVEQYAIDYDNSNPQVNDTGDLNNIYGIEFYPTYYVVCPDRSMLQYSGDGPAAIEAALNEGIDYCAPFDVVDVDARVFAYNSATTVCSETTTPSIKLMNMGQENLTSVDITVLLDGVLQSTTDWSGDLVLYGHEDVVLPEVDLSGSTNPELEVLLSNPNGGMDNNPSNDSVTLDIDYGGATYETITVHFELAFDNFPQETSWEFLNSVGQVAASGSGYQGYPDFSPPIDTYLELPGGDCYTFIIYDSFSDGICCNFADEGEGFWRISTDAEVLIGEGGVFTDQESLLFGVAENVGLSERDDSGIARIYPNPSQGPFNVSFDKQYSEVTGTVYDLGGREVLRINTENTDHLDFELDAPEGTYVLKMWCDGRGFTALVVKQ